MNGSRSVFRLPHPAPWWDLPAHVTAANLGWWITGLLVTAAVLYWLPARTGARRAISRRRQADTDPACPYEMCHHNHPERDRSRP